MLLAKVHPRSIAYPWCASTPQLTHMETAPRQCIRQQRLTSGKFRSRDDIGDAKVESRSFDGKIADDWENIMSEGLRGEAEIAEGEFRWKKKNCTEELYLSAGGHDVPWYYTRVIYCLKFLNIHRYGLFVTPFCYRGWARESWGLVCDPITYGHESSENNGFSMCLLWIYVRELDVEVEEKKITKRFHITPSLWNEDWVWWWLVHKVLILISGFVV